MALIFQVRIDLDKRPWGLIDIAQDLRTFADALSSISVEQLKNGIALADFEGIADVVVEDVRDTDKIIGSVWLTELPDATMFPRDPIEPGFGPVPGSEGEHLEDLAPQDFADVRKELGEHLEEEGP